MSNRPNYTAHLYETSEINSMHQNAIRLGKINDAVFATIERDVSGNGNAAFSSNFASSTEDIGIANPTSVLTTLIQYNKWFNIMKQKFKGSTGKSYTCVEARKLLVTSTVSLARSNKSRLGPDISITSINMKLDQVASMTPDDFESNVEIEEASKWISKLGPATGTTCEGNVGIDAEKVIKLFGILLCKTAQVWSKIAKKTANIKKLELNAEDPTIDKTAIEDPEADEKTVLVLELNLVMLGQLIYTIDTYEKRRLPKMKPEFVRKALNEFPPAWQNQFPKIGGKSEKMFARPIAWVFCLLFEVAYQMYPQKNNSVILVLLSLLELCAREVGNDRSNFLNAILFTVRCRTLGWKNNEKKPEDIVEEPEIAELLKLYDECPPLIEGSDNDDILDPIKLASRRRIMIPQQYLDRTTFRGKGKTTLDYLTKGAAAMKVDIRDWETEEIEKSHGPGMELYKKQSEGTPTFMSFYIEHSTSLNSEQDCLDNPYKQKANKYLMRSEENFGHEKSTEKEMAIRMYQKWVSAFPCNLPERIDDLQDEGKTKRVGKGKTEKGSKVTTLNNKRTLPSKKGQKSTFEMSKKKSTQEPEERMIIVQRKSKNGLEPSLKPGSLIRIKKIIYEEIQDENEKEVEQEETNEYIKKQVIMQKQQQSGESSDQSENEEIKDNVEDENSEEEAKKISKLKKAQQKLKAISNPSKKTTLKNRKRLEQEDNCIDIDETKGNKPVLANRKRSRKLFDPEASSEKSIIKKQKKSKASDLAKFNILDAYDYELLTDEEKRELEHAPLAQKPIGNAKKFVYVVGDKIYKGPYNAALNKDVEAVQRVMYRIYRMKNQWHDLILIDQQLVYDENEKLLYLRSENVSKCRNYETEEITLNTHDKKKVQIIKKDTSGIQLLSKVIQTSDFEKLISLAIVDLAARYLIGSGGGHFGEIIVTEDGEEMAAIDVEDNREKVPLYTDIPTPHLLDILFVNKKQPAKSNDKFYTLLPQTFDCLKEFIQRVRAENVEETVAFAKKIGYLSYPSEQIIHKRLETLEKCIKDNEDSQKNLKTNGNGIPEMPDYDDDNKLAEVVNTIL